MNSNAQVSWLYIIRHWSEDLTAEMDIFKLNSSTWLIPSPSVFISKSSLNNYSSQCESWNILLMRCTTPFIPLRPDIRPCFQLRSHRCDDRLGESHIWTNEEFCHTCKWATDALSRIPQSERWWWCCQCRLPAGHDARGNLNAAQTACKGEHEQMRSCTVRCTWLISVSTLTDKKIYLGADFLLSQLKKKWITHRPFKVGRRFYSGWVRSPDEMSVKHQRVRERKWKVSMFMNHSPEGILLRVFWQSLHNCIKEERVPVCLRSWGNFTQPNEQINKVYSCTRSRGEQLIAEKQP